MRARLKLEELADLGILIDAEADPRTGVHDDVDRFVINW